ncbi:MAG TPA: glycosyltransferase family 4 protein [Gallicola sp.]|nr:glycosyltransferase family 4 protein [Gallicola sp.]
MSVGDKSYKDLLLISRGAWRDDRNSGSTYTSIFASWPRDKISQLYCRPDKPDNTICERYFQISDKDILQSIFSFNKRAGKCFNTSSLDKKNKPSKEKKIISLIRNSDSYVLRIIRELLWAIGRIDYEELDSWLNNIKPEIIHLSGTDSIYMYLIANNIIRKLKIPFVIYISDDIYTYKQYNWSPFFWLHRFILRKFVRKSIKSAERVFVISPLQKREYEKIFNREMDILSKSIKNECQDKYEFEKPIEITYMGNIASGRWKTLELIIKELKLINESDKSYFLSIYSNLSVPESIKNRLTVEGISELKEPVNSQKVNEILLNSDILLHVESFRLKDFLKTRLSFSAKIVDYFEAGRCILAIGDSTNASIQYLKEKDAAYIIDSDKVLVVREKLKELLYDENLIKKYAYKSMECGRDYHGVGMTKEKYRVIISEI